MDMSYLGDLAIRLAGGATAFSNDFRRRHTEFLAKAAGPDGGYCGRQGRSDPYYTSFALRSLAMLDGLDCEIAAAAAAFLQNLETQNISGIDFFSWLLSAELLRVVAAVDAFADSNMQLSGQDRSQAIVARIDSYHRPDGGYAKLPSSPAGGIYHTFLALACKELFAETPLSESDESWKKAVHRLVDSRRREDGGYVEIAQMRQSGTNPTAAAVAILRIAGRLDDQTQDNSRRSAIDFLSAMQTGEGGFRANTRIPFADLLSTFTALTALHDLFAGGENSLSDSVDLAAARRYALSLESPQGGFRAAAWDDRPDVEYTFYGLGTLALLNAEGFRDKRKSWR